MSRRLDREPETAGPRGCDLCGSALFDLIYRQRFATFDDSSALPGYDVVVCAACGFAYADRIPRQTVFDRYYREMSKYELAAGHETVSASAAPNYRAIVGEISDRLKRTDLRILDVGSGAGHLLAAFKSAGFSNVRGFDPSVRCAEYARSTYGIEVVGYPISQMAHDGERYDLILLSSVLEHLRDLVPTVRSLVELLAPDGRIWFEVPDAARFAEDVSVPFQQFSLEHINFFTQGSLRALLSRVGFEPVDIWTTNRRLGEIDACALDGLFQLGGVRRRSPPDESGGGALKRYVAASRPVYERLIRTLLASARSGDPVLVWGTGSLTLQLLGDERLSDLPIEAFIDANRNYHGKTIRGVPVRSPDSLGDPLGPIVVVSGVYENEIAEAIRERYHLENRIVKLVTDSADQCAAEPTLAGAGSDR
jgi:SAM-dependent methyltransferase